MINILEETARTLIKICGIRTARDAQAIVGLGADLIGVNFWPSSKRFLDPDDAQEWVPDMCYRTTVVGLFVNPDIDEVIGHFENELFGVAQLHGDESPEFCRHLEDREIPFIKALGVTDHADLGDLDRFGTDYLLLDRAQGGFGGGGLAFNWKIAAEIIQAWPDKRFLLAGGINPGNAMEAITVAQPAGVDVASGVESVTGIKDLGLVEDLIRQVRRVDGSADGA